MTFTIGFIRVFLNYQQHKVSVSTNYFFPFLSFVTVVIFAKVMFLHLSVYPQGVEVSRPSPGGGVWGSGRGVSRPRPRGEGGGWGSGWGVSRPRPRGRLGVWQGGCPGPSPGGGWGILLGGVSKPRPRRRLGVWPGGCPGPGPGGLAWGVSRPRPRGGVSQHVLRQTPPSADSYCCGRYASYWNAFLLHL